MLVTVAMNLFGQLRENRVVANDSGEKRISNGINFFMLHPKARGHPNLLQITTASTVPIFYGDNLKNRHQNITTYNKATPKLTLEKCQK